MQYNLWAPLVPDPPLSRRLPLVTAQLSRRSRRNGPANCFFFDKFVGKLAVLSDYAESHVLRIHSRVQSCVTLIETYERKLKSDKRLLCSQRENPRRLAFFTSSPSSFKHDHNFLRKLFFALEQ